MKKTNNAKFRIRLINDRLQSQKLHATAKRYSNENVRLK